MLGQPTLKLLQGAAGILLGGAAQEDTELVTPQSGHHVGVPKGEEKLQEKIANRFDKLGCETHLLKLLPTTVQLHREFAVQEAIDMNVRTHVVGKVNGSGAGRSLILITHPDADPIDTEGWTKEPHTGQVVNGRMYGWAVADDLAGICITLAA